MTRRLIVGSFLVAALAACANEPQPAATAPPEPAHDMPPAASAPAAPPTTDAALIQSAKAAAPASVSDAATVIAMNEKMEMRTLQAGTNGWTCMPDNPQSPGTDPMCLDKNGLEWASAWMAKKDPAKGKMGFGYMLMGGSDASNDDPFATSPKPGARWVDTGPHVMILNIGDQFDGYPTTPDDPSKPYVMFPNTPYRHLMIPVR